MASVGLLGDVMLGRGVAEALGETPAAELWGEELRELCASLDLVPAISSAASPSGASPPGESRQAVLLSCSPGRR